MPLLAASLPHGRYPTRQGSIFAHAPNADLITGTIRVPVVYLDSALVLVLLDREDRDINNLRGISRRIGSESHPLRQKSVILRIDDPPHG